MNEVRDIGTPLVISISCGSVYESRWPRHCEESDTVRDMGTPLLRIPVKTDVDKPVYHRFYPRVVGTPDSRDVGTPKTLKSA